MTLLLFIFFNFYFFDGHALFQQKAWSEVISGLVDNYFSDKFDIRRTIKLHLHLQPRKHDRTKSDFKMSLAFD